MKVYIAGPMRGYEQYNFPAFDDAERQWRRMGNTPISPATLDRIHEGSDGNGAFEDDDMRRVTRRDLMATLDADAVAVLPGWQRSRGALLEVMLARSVGMPIYDAKTAEELPWRSVLIQMAEGILEAAKR